MSAVPSVAETYRILTGKDSNVVGRRNGSELYVQCVAPEQHSCGDAHPSLRINTAKDVWRCDPCNAGGKSLKLVQHAQRANNDASALAFLGVVHDGETQETRRHVSRAVAEYQYLDERGKILYSVTRFERGGSGKKKSFVQKRANGNAGAFVTGRNCMEGVRRVPYRLPELRAAIEAGDTVYVVEGEQDVNTLAKLGLAATTNAGGTGFTWPPEWAAHFVGAKQIIVVPDCDKAGRKAAQRWAEVLTPVCCDVRKLDIGPDRSDGYDISDWLTEGNTADELRDMAARAQTGQGRRLSIVTLADVKSEEIKWVWGRRIPLGKVTLLVGDPGAGKSFASMAIASAITNGRTLPDDDEADSLPASVVLWNGEDGIADTIRPRAYNLGVDLSRLHVIEGEVDSNARSIPFSLRSMDILLGAIQKLDNVRLVIVDPIAALLGGVDAHRDTEVRCALQPLVDLAQAARVAVLCIMHLRKGEAQRALYRVGGSIGFVGLARSVLLAAEDPESGRRAIAPLKSNLGPMPTPVEYRLDEEGRFWWGSAVEDLTAEHLLRSPRRENGGATREAEDFLQDLLTDGPVSESVVREKTLAAAISLSTYKRARRNLCVQSQRVSAQNGQHGQGEWMVSLPENTSRDSRGSNHTPETLDPLEKEARGVLSTRGRMCSHCAKVARCYERDNGAQICTYCVAEGI